MTIIGGVDRRAQSKGVDVMRKLLSALMFAAMLATPGLASARDGWDRWDGDRREWRDHDRHDRRWRDDDRRERRWRHRESRRDRWHDRRHWRNDRYGYYDRGRIVCRTYWDRYGYPDRVCWRR